MKLTRDIISILRLGTKVEVAKEVKNVSFDRHVGRRYRLGEWWW